MRGSLARDQVPAEAENLLSVTAVPGRRGRVVLEVVGEVDGCTAPLLESCLRSQTGRPRLRVLVVDLARATFLAAAGLSVLAAAQRTCRERGARLVVRSRPGSLVARLVQRAGLPVAPGQQRGITGF